MVTNDNKKAGFLSGGVSALGGAVVGVAWGISPDFTAAALSTVSVGVGVGFGTFAYGTDTVVSNSVSAVAGNAVGVAVGLEAKTGAISSSISALVRAPV